jgi:hypothetical protein
MMLGMMEELSMSEGATRNRQRTEMLAGVVRIVIVRTVTV